jgi:hypothetical protein
MSPPGNANGQDFARVKAAQENQPNFYSASSDAARKANDAKRLATLTARAALAGITLYATDDDRGRRVYVVSRWSLTKQIDDESGLDAVERWLDMVSGTKA